MVRTTIAFAVVALGAAAVIAQAPEGSSQLEARDFNDDLELREYVVDDLEARDLEDIVDIDAREPEVFFEEVYAREPQPEFFDDIEAREYEADELEARDFDDEGLEARAPAPTAGGQNPLPNPPSHLHEAEDGALTPTPAASDDPSKVVTVTMTPTPTPCTKKELKSQKEEKKVDKALGVLRTAKGKKDLSTKEKLQVKKARKYLRRVRRRRARAAKRTVNKCRSALRKAGLSAKKCKAGANCDSALTGKSISPAKCTDASKLLTRLKAAKKSHKAARKSKNHHKSKKSGKSAMKLLTASKTTSNVGADGVTTVTVNAGPTCTASPGSASRMKKHIVPRDILDEEFDSVFAREYDFDNLD